MLKRFLFLSSILLAAASFAVAVNAKEKESGLELFEKHCSHCHAPGLNRPGTLQLSLTRGEDNAVLEQRDNLSAVYIKAIVRQGLNAMPAFKPTIVTKEELDAIGKYLGK